MSWKVKVSYSNMVLFCDIYRTRKEIAQHFDISPIQAWHAIKWFSKFTDDFVIEKDAGTTNKAWWIKSRAEAYNKYKLESYSLE